MELEEKINIGKREGVRREEVSRIKTDKEKEDKERDKRKRKLHQKLQKNIPKISRKINTDPSYLRPQNIRFNCRLLRQLQSAGRGGDVPRGLASFYAVTLNDPMIR